MATSRVRNTLGVLWQLRYIAFSDGVHRQRVSSERKIGDDNRYGGPAGEYVLTINYNFDIQNFPSRGEIRDKVPCSGLFFANRCAARVALRLIMIPQFTSPFFFLVPNHRARDGRTSILIRRKNYYRETVKGTPAKGDASQKEESLIAIKLTCVCLIHYASCLTDLTAGRYRS